MDLTAIDAAGQALTVLADPLRLAMLALGVVLGLILGILPGIGGVAGTAMLLPFTYSLDPYAAFALLLGLGATTATGDPIPAILFGVPGGAGSAATVLDGLPMAKRGEAGRALSAAYMSSLLGGVFGAVLMGILLPVIRPLMLYIGSPELLALSVLGISMVAVLAGNAPLRGLVAGCAGVLISMVGADPQTDTLRWSLGTFYLWEGMPIVPIVLGLFALPELADLAIRRTSIASGSAQFQTSWRGMVQGARDCFRHWWLVLRCSWLGAFLGAVPGLGGSVIDWLAYGHAARTEKGAAQSFGQGDVRGVIASESANNAKEGGALLPTIAFGVPGSAGMAVLMGAFLIHGLTPGPDMLTKHLDLSYTMVWSIALANILGAGACYLLSAQFARLATLRYTLILPAILGIIYVGAFQGSRQWGDLYVLLLFGVVGWVMKELRWPRPPLILGVVLGAMIERYMFISIQRYELSWLTRPIVLVLFAIALFGILRPVLPTLWGGARRRIALGPFQPRAAHLFHAGLLALFAWMLAEALTWPLNARLAPQIVLVLALLICGTSLVADLFRPGTSAGGSGSAASLHMDLIADRDGLPMRQVLLRAATFFGWIVAVMVSMAAIGLVATLPLFVIAYMRLEGREPWRLVLPQAICLALFVYVVFDQLLHLPWPRTLLGAWVPTLRTFIPSL